MLPRRAIRESRVVAKRLAILGLVFLAEMPTARLLAMERVSAHQLRELEEIRHAAAALERLIQLRIAPGDIDVAPELLTELRELLQRRAKAFGVPGHAAVLPHHPAELAMEGIDRARAARLQEPPVPRFHVVDHIGERR